MGSQSIGLGVDFQPKRRKRRPDFNNCALIINKSAVQVVDFSALNGTLRPIFLCAECANLCAENRQKSAQSPPLHTPTPAKNYPQFFENQRYITKKRHIFVKTCVFSAI